MRTVYVATRFDNYQAARDMLAALSDQYTPAYDWTQHAVDGADPISHTNRARLAEVARDTLQAIERCDLFVALLPGGRGTNAEIGAALAFGRRVVLVGPTTDDSGRLCPLYELAAWKYPTSTAMLAARSSKAAPQ